METVRFLALGIFVFSLMGCDPEYCYDYLIHNNSQNDVELFIYGEEDSNIIIEKDEQFTQLSFCGMGKSYFEYNLTDSIQIKVDNIVRKTYYPSDEGKNIFKTQDQDSWRLVKNRRYYSKFVFEITEEDLQ